ncbi:MAG: EAL domain-containing protein [Gemmatimonadota bacterium]
MMRFLDGTATARGAPLILVVDDDSTTRMLLRESLEAGGFRVEEATDGERAVERFADVLPDVVLLDVVMPGLDGFETCRMLRTLPNGIGARVPIVMTTGLDDIESVNRAYEAGATDFITKPIVWPILAHRVRYILRAAQGSDALLRSEERLAEAQEMALLGYWDWSLADGVVQRSDALLRMLGVSRAEFARDSKAMFARLDRDDAQSLVVAHEGATQYGEPFSLEVRWQHPDGAVRILHEQGAVDRDATGKPVRIHGTTQDITARRAAEDRVRQLALYDPLTSLPNRRFFNEQLALSLAHAKRLTAPYGVLVLNLDRFKRINESFGRGAGDDVLHEVALRLERALRLPEFRAQVAGAAASVNLARHGGDEFTIGLAGLAEGADAARVAERLLELIATPMMVEGQETVLHASIGIAIYPTDGEDADALLMNADSAMHLAKREGKNTYRFYSPAIHARSSEKLGMENGLRKALERDELVLYYQPKSCAITGEITGVEALIRWDHPQLGMVGPGEFIPVAEEAGLIVQIGEWALHTACAQLAEWRAAGFNNLTMAVNMASPNFAHAGFVGVVRAAVAAAGIPPERLEIELTESAIIRDVEATIPMLRALTATGVRLAVDDFGTGYSSLAYLSQFPIDGLKIDRTFVREVATRPEAAAIAKAIIAMGRSLGVEVIAEGIEDEDQASFLRDAGCHTMQGYFFGRPMSAANIESRLLAGMAAVGA